MAPGGHACTLRRMRQSQWGPGNAGALTDARSDACMQKPNVFFLLSFQLSKRRLPERNNVARYLDLVRY